MLNGKFICVRECDITFMIKDRVYEFIDGRFVMENGKLNSYYFKSIEEFNILQGSQIAPYQPKLEVEFRQWDNVICAKVIHQDEKLRNERSIIKNLKAGITSIRNPAIEQEQPTSGYYLLCIRGRDEEFDNKIATYSFDTTEEANEWLKNIKELIYEINNPVSEKDRKIDELQAKMDELKAEIEKLRGK